MAQKPLDTRLMQQALDELAAASGNVSAAARNLGLDRSTFRHRIDSARLNGLVPHIAPPKPRIRVPARSRYEPLPNEAGAPIRVLVWGCAHDTPLIPDKSRFANAGKLAAELRPHYIVDLGDSMDLDSLSLHAVPGSVDDRARPGFLAEVESLTEAYASFHQHAPSSDDIPRYHLHGNHEYRANRFEANNPAATGVYTIPISQVYARMGWTELQYREWLYLEGVGFTHVPINAMGREYGGKTAENLVMNESTHSIVWSHTHRQHFARRPKIGIGNGLQSYNTGSFMPQGYLKQYAGLSQTGWTYGVSELTLRNGQIESARYWSERELAERYA